LGWNSTDVFPNCFNKLIPWISIHWSWLIKCKYVIGWSAWSFRKFVDIISSVLDIFHRNIIQFTIIIANSLSHCFPIVGKLSFILIFHWESQLPFIFTFQNKLLPSVILSVKVKHGMIFKIFTSLNGSFILNCIILVWFDPHSSNGSHLMSVITLMLCMIGKNLHIDITVSLATRTRFTAYIYS